MIDFIARLCLVTPFLILAAHKAFFFQKYMERIALLGGHISGPIMVMAIIVELVGAYCILTQQKVTFAKIILIITVIVATFIMYHPLNPSSTSLKEILKNISIIGGLLLVSEGKTRRRVSRVQKGRNAS